MKHRLQLTRFGKLDLATDNVATYFERQKPRNMGEWETTLTAEDECGRRNDFYRFKYFFDISPTECNIVTREFSAFCFGW